MRLVVGPLPASVYWRRRALVLGGVALVVALIVYSCATTGKTSATPGGSATPVAPPATSTPTPASSPTAVVAPAGVKSATPGPPPVVDAATCTDGELSVTAVPAKTTTPRGTELLIKLLIKNTSQRTCNRDIGPDQQELYVVVGTERVWSSDHCDGPTGSDQRSFPPGHERSYEVIWNGKSSSSCSSTTKRTPDGPVPAAGEYQLLGRVGTDISEPVLLKLT